MSSHALLTRTAAAVSLGLLSILLAGSGSALAQAVPPILGQNGVQTNTNNNQGPSFSASGVDSEGLIYIRSNSDANQPNGIEGVLLAGYGNNKSDLRNFFFGYYDPTKNTTNVIIGDPGTGNNGNKLTMYGGQIAVGNGAVANVDTATAIGVNAKATAAGAFAMGVDSSASNLNAVAMGTQANASGRNSTAIGANANASGANSLSMGSNSAAAGNNSTALGANSRANNDNDVALGSGSTTQKVVQTSTMVINGKTYNVAGNATSTVSVGSPGSERTITNVAAGRVSANSTDAVNGSQLYAANQAIENLSSQIGGLRDEARQAGAVGLAAASLRFDNRPGKLSLALGGSLWRGQGAFAAGLGYTSDNQRARGNLTAATSGGGWGISGGLGFTLN